MGDTSGEKNKMRNKAKPDQAVVFAQDLPGVHSVYTGVRLREGDYVASIVYARAIEEGFFVEQVRGYLLDDNDSIMTPQHLGNLINEVHPLVKEPKYHGNNTLCVRNNYHKWLHFPIRGILAEEAKVRKLDDTEFNFLVTKLKALDGEPIPRAFTIHDSGCGAFPKGFEPQNSKSNPSS